MTTQTMQCRARVFHALVALAVPMVFLGIGAPVWLADPDEEDRVSPAAPKPTSSLTNSPAEKKDAGPIQISPGQEDPSANPPRPSILQRPAPPTAPVPPLSEGLAEVVRLTQAGLDEDVVLTYIQNSTNIFHITSQEIVYLNDLGVSTSVIKALIEKDYSPETEARKKGAAAVKPLPEEYKLTQPATNIYPASGSTSNLVQVPAIPADWRTEASAEAPVSEGPVPENVQVYAPTEEEAVPEPVSYFYPALASYGTWYVIPGYGHCWRPTVAVVNPYWRPYADYGRWIWSNHGWYWYSYYTWGWAPFHYGRWCSYPGMGWVWAPDYVWGPSWVSWRYTKFYCGWAPLPPHCNYVSGFGLTYHGSSVGLHFGFGYGYQHYAFVPYSYFCDYKPYHYYASHAEARAIYKDSTVINNYVVGDNNTIINNGVGLDPVTRASRAEVPTFAVRDDAAAPNVNERRERLGTEGNNPVILRPPPPATSSLPSRQDRSSQRAAALQTGGALAGAAASTSSLTPSPSGVPTSTGAVPSGSGASLPARRAVGGGSGIAGAPGRAAAQSGPLNPQTASTAPPNLNVSKDPSGRSAARVESAGQAVPPAASPAPNGSVSPGSRSSRSQSSRTVSSSRGPSTSGTPASVPQGVPQGRGNSRGTAGQDVSSPQAVPKADAVQATAPVSTPSSVPSPTGRAAVGTAGSRNPSSQPQGTPLRTFPVYPGTPSRPAGTPVATPDSYNQSRGVTRGQAPGSESGIPSVRGNQPQFGNQGSGAAMGTGNPQSGRVPASVPRMEGRGSPMGSMPSIRSAPAAPSSGAQSPRAQSGGTSGGSAAYSAPSVPAPSAPSAPPPSVSRGSRPSGSRGQPR